MTRLVDFDAVDEALEAAAAACPDRRNPIGRLWTDGWPCGLAGHALARLGVDESDLVDDEGRDICCVLGLRRMRRFAFTADAYGLLVEAEQASNEQRPWWDAYRYAKARADWRRSRIRRFVLVAGSAQ